MGIGQFNNRVTFESRTVADDGAGGGSVSWTTALVVWGYLAPERGRETLAAGRLQSATMGVLRIRSSAAALLIDPSYRVTIDGAAYQIRTITNPDQRNRFLEMVVEKGVAT